MSAPLSASQPFPQQETGMFGGPQGRIRPRGAYAVAGVGDPQMGYNGYGAFWGLYPGIIGGLSGAGSVSTTTGATVGTPGEESMEKVGGGAVGTSAETVPTGNTVGGTAAY